MDTDDIIERLDRLTSVMEAYVRTTSKGSSGSTDRSTERLLGLTTDNLKNLDGALTKLEAKLGDTSRRLVKDSAEEKRIRESARVLYKKLNDEYKNGEISSDQFNEELHELKKTLETVKDSAGDVDKELVNEVNSKIKAREITEKLKTSFTTVTGASALAGASLGAIGKVGSSVKNILSDIQNGGSGASIATAGMTAAVDLSASALQGASSGMTALGGAMKGKLGVGLTVAGSALGLFTSAVSAAAKATIEVLSKQVTSLTEGFMTATSAGATFAGGATEMLEASTSAGVGIKTFGDMVKNNTETMYKSGLTVGQASKTMAKTFNAGGSAFKDQLFGLGYNMEQQGALVAETMQYLTLAGKNVRNMTGGEIANATRDYAVNLKTIAAITGEDAKKRMDQAREASANAAVQAKLARMSEDEREKFTAGLAAVPKELQNAVLQQRILGQVVDKNAAIMMSQVPGLAAGVESMASNLQNGAEAVGRDREKIAGLLKDAMTDGSALSTMGITAMVGISGPAADAANGLAKLSLELQSGANVKGSVDQAVAELTRVLAGEDGLTKQLSSMQSQGHAFASQLDSITKDVLPDYTRLMVATNEKMKEMLGDAGKAINDTIGSMSDSAKKEQGIFDDLGKHVGIVGALTAALGGAMVVAGGVMSATGIGAAAGVPLAAAGASMFSGGLATAGIGGTLSTIGFSNGGVSTGPDSGYLQKLHGTELVLPTKSGKLDYSSKGFEILSSMITNDNSVTNTTNNASKMSESTVVTTSAKSIDNSELMKKQIDLMTQFVEKADELVDAVNDQKAIQQSILQATY